MDDIKYLANGEAVKVMQDIEGGLLVNKVLYDPHD
jgi:hypothetical protein